MPKTHYGFIPIGKGYAVIWSRDLVFWYPAYYGPMTQHEAAHTFDLAP